MHPTPQPPSSEDSLESASFKTRLEWLVHGMRPEQADAFMMLTKESRGAFALFFEASDGAALFVGNAQSGTPVALATLGFHVTILDRSEERLRFAQLRGEALVPGMTSAVLGGGDATLPFGDGAFRVAVMEGGLPSAATGWGFRPDELRRAASEEVIVTADNRLGYKRSTGRRGGFSRDPRLLIAEILRPSRGEATLPTTRAAVRGRRSGTTAPWPQVRAFSLYPHAREFSHVVGLDAPEPRLTIGPREKKNRLKMIGHGLGLFPWLTPSFAIHATRSPRPVHDRLARILQCLGEHVGEKTPVADVMVATRSNDALIHTAQRLAGGRPPLRAPGDPPHPEGRWTLHVPLQPAKRRMVATHHGWLARIRRDYPNLPVPEPLFLGTLEGLELAVERRLHGLSGTDITGDLKRTTRMFQDCAEHAARLVDDTHTAIDEHLWTALFEERFDRVERLVRSPGTLEAVRAMRATVRDRIFGTDQRLAIYHADLRGKHVQVNGADGRVIGFLDWGASEERFLPFIDLIHLVVHQRKQERGGSFGDAWRALRAPEQRRPHEQDALDTYLERSALDPADLAFYMETYPLFVAGMAERNWDYSRPDWVHRQFGI